MSNPFITEWGPEADAFLRRFGPTSALATLTRHFHGVGSEQIKNRAESLGIKVGEFKARSRVFTLPPSIADWPALPIDALPTETPTGLVVVLHDTGLQGVPRILFHRQRGHFETLSPKFANELLGGEESKVETLKQVRQQKKSRTGK